MFFLRQHFFIFFFLLIIGSSSIIVNTHHVVDAFSIASSSSSLSSPSRRRRTHFLLHSSSTSSTTSLSSSSSSIGHGNGMLKNALKKMRGPSVSIEYTKNTSNNSNHDNNSNQMDLELFSQELRCKAKASAIVYSSMNCSRDKDNDNNDALEVILKEQQSAKGNFPSPCPIVYSYNKDHDDDEHLQNAIDMGITAILFNDVMDMQYFLNNNNNNNNDDDDDDSNDVEIICQVNSVNDVQIAVQECGFDYAFLLSTSFTNEIIFQNDDHDHDAITNTILNELHSIIPKDALVIASLQSMQPDSIEIKKAKELIATTSTNTNKLKIHGLLFQDACVGDDEDIPYTSFVVGGVTKKSSSTFAMTGLTGSTNGHFGTLSDNISLDKKWKRSMEI